MTLEIKAAVPVKQFSTFTRRHIASIEYTFRTDYGTVFEHVVCHEKAARANICRAAFRLFQNPPYIQGIRFALQSPENSEAKPEEGAQGQEETGHNTS